MRRKNPLSIALYNHSQITKRRNFAETARDNVVARLHNMAWHSAAQRSTAVDIETKHRQHRRRNAVLLTDRYKQTWTTRHPPERALETAVDRDSWNQAAEVGSREQPQQYHGHDSSVSYNRSCNRSCDLHLQRG